MTMKHQQEGYNHAARHGLRLLKHNLSMADDVLIPQMKQVGYLCGVEYKWHDAIDVLELLAAGGYVRRNHERWEITHKGYLT